ncbi:uncharacterized protein LOC128170463 isoform X1 [Crassostrea angulata]|uniref:uncharacterized protein LOC128170463 isoform X1 n=1 Tax=Magallana angulata TaxID=2784310 RepID=UPI0022B0B923|nr:uncharacterized protein LOC128170463 isoform X1 [Crassostrea angulata]
MIQMGQVRLKHVVLFLLLSHQFIMTSAVVTNNRLLLAVGLATGAILSSYNGSYDWSPSTLAVLTAIILVTLLPTTINKADSSSCTAPGYSLHPVLGCIKLSTSTTALTPEQWVAKCAEDGGKLILINSATENQALVDFLKSDPKDVVIQGSRVSVSSPWTTDDGQPLPFVGEFQGISNLAGTLRIIFTSSGKWASVNPTNVFPNAVCEIPV